MESVSKGIEIMENMIGHTSGFAIPTYVIDAPGGGGKIPVMPTYAISQAPQKETKLDRSSNTNYN